MAPRRSERGLQSACIDDIIPSEGRLSSEADPKTSEHGLQSQMFGCMPTFCVPERVSKCHRALEQLQDVCESRCTPFAGSLLPKLSRICSLSAPLLQAEHVT